MWGWSWESRGPGRAERADWAGVLTAPRAVDVHADGTLRVLPAPELDRLRAPEPFVTVPGTGARLPDAYDLTVTARTLTTVRLGEGLTLRIDPAAGTLTVRRAGRPAPVEVRIPRGAELHVRVLVDGSLYEVFADDRATVTERVYRRPGDAPELTVTGAEATVTAWELVGPTLN
jgi:beta-fructofuranosidase